MKTKWLALLAFLWVAQAQAFEQIEANVKYPVGMGTTSSGYSSMVGFGASIYVSPMLDDSISNYLSVGYNSYRIRADGTSSLKIIPVLANIEFNGKATKDLNTTLSVGAGFAAAFVSVTNQSIFNWSAYFAAQIKPGFEYSIADGITIVGHTPVTAFFSRAFLSSMDFDMGVKFKL
jgi:hypothetical protein